MDNAQRITELVDTKRVMEDSGIRFNSKGFCRCFLHNEKTASMSIKNNHYKCFGCGAYGGPIDFVIKHDGLSFKQALVRLDSQYHLGVIGRRPTYRERLQERENRRMREFAHEGYQRYDKAYKTLTDLYRIASKTAMALRDKWLDDYAAEMEEVLDTHSGMEAYAWLHR